MEIRGEHALLYPIFLDLTGRRCVIVGGGMVASRKARKLLQAQAAVTVVAPEVSEELAGMATEVRPRPYEEGDLAGAYLAFAATDAREVNARVAREAQELGIPVNVADEPDEGDFALPSTLRRGRLQVSVSTGGASPTLARRIRTELERLFEPGWSGVVEELARARRAGEPPSEGTGGEVSRCLSRLRG